MSDISQPKLNEKKTVQLSWLDIVAFFVVLVLTAVLIKSFTLDFLEKPLHITLSYLGFFIVATTYIVTKRKHFNSQAIFPALLALLTAASFIIHGAEQHFLVSFLMLIYLSGSYCVKLTNTATASWGSYFYLLDVFKSEFALPLKNLFLPFCSLKTLKKETENKDKKFSGKCSGVFIGILFAIPALAVILPILLRSDAAFESLTSGILHKLSEFFSDIFADAADPYYVLFLWLPTIIVAPYIYSVMFCFRHSIKSNKESNTGSIFCRIRFVPVNVFAGFLGAICLVYVVYLFSQSAYFFSAFTGKLPNGLEITVTDYARRGFFEMVIIAFINFALIGITVLLSKRSDSKLHKVIKGLDFFLCMFTVILVLTSISKIFLYISEMGLTHKRIYVFVIDVILIVCFSAVIIRLFKEHFPYMKVILGFTCCAVTLVSLVGVDGAIAKYNTEMYLNGQHKTVDISSLESLGLPALKYLDKLAECEDKAVSNSAKDSVANLFYCDVMNYKKPDGTPETMRPAYEKSATVEDFFAMRYAEENFKRLAEIHAQNGWWYSD